MRFKISLHGQTFVHDSKTDVFLRSVKVTRRADRVHLLMECIEIIMTRATTNMMLTDALHMLDPHSKWEIIEPILAELQRSDYKPRRPRDADTSREPPDAPDQERREVDD